MYANEDQVVFLIWFVNNSFYMRNLSNTGLLFIKYSKDSFRHTDCACQHIGAHCNNHINLLSEEKILAFKENRYHEGNS